MIEFSVQLANRPGQLALLARRLGEANVNIESLAAFTTGPEGLVKMVVDNDDQARRVLEDADVPYSEHRVISATLQDKPGALAELTEALANTGVNIEAIYLLHSEEGTLRFALAVDDPSAVAHV